MSSTNRLRHAWKIALLASSMLYAGLALLTYGSHPMFGEITVRGTLNRDPNLLRLDILREARQKHLPPEQKGQLLDPEMCLQCFSPYSYKRYTDFEDGFYRNTHFQPTLSYFHDGNRIPILFMNRIGGAPYALVKFLKERAGLEPALLFYHLAIGLLFLFLFGKGALLLFGPSVSIVAMFLIAVSPIHILNNGPYLSVKAVPLALWIYVLGISARRTSTSFLLCALSSAWFFLIKATALFSALAGAVLTWRTTWKRKWLAALAFLSGLIPFLLLSEKTGFVQEYYHTAEYLKGSKYAWAAFLDSILLVSHPLAFLEFFLAIDSWHFPFTTGTPTDHAYAAFQPWDRMAGFGPVSIFLLGFFLIPLVFRGQFRFRRARPVYMSLLLLLVTLFFAAHKYFAFSDYFTAALSLVILIHAMVFRGLLTVRTGRLARIASRCVLACYILALAVQLTQFVAIYREKGPEPTFSHDFYRHLSRDLIKRGIRSPYMFYVSEFGNLENQSEEVLPTYIEESLMENFGVLFEVAKEGFALLQLKPNWVESSWGRTLTKEEVLRQAEALNVSIEHVTDYLYRGEPKYWLFRFSHQEPNAFADTPVTIPDEEYQRLYRSYIPFR